MTLKNKRFLIVWFLTSGFALLCNVANLRGEIKENKLNSRGKYDMYINILTGYENPENSFWPFTNTFIEKYRYISVNDTTVPDDLIKGFAGIFNGFDYLEFIVYGIVALAIIYIPKMWK